MAKPFCAVAMLMAVSFGVWGCFGSMMQPTPLVERELGPFYLLIVNDTGTKEGDIKAMNEAKEALSAAGVKTLPERATCVTYSDVREGLTLRKEDFAKARSLGGPFEAVEVPRQRGWATEGEGTSEHSLGTGSATGRLYGTLLGKARNLGWTSYCLMNFDVAMTTGAVFPFSKSTPMMPDP